jgi:TPP-dependent 2-oxoacid decarboxylase
MDGGSVHVSFASTSGPTNTAVVTMGVGAVSSSKKYILKYSLKGSNDNGLSIGAYLRKDGDPYNDITTRSYAKISSSRTENEVLFAFPETQSNATLMFIVNNQNQEFWLDNVQLYEADLPAMR